MSVPNLYVDTKTQSHDPGEPAPERPDRIDVCLEAIRQTDLQFVRSDSQQADEGEVLTVHEEEYVDWLRDFCNTGGGTIDSDTSAGPGSFDVALRAFGSAIAAARGAMKNAAKAFCIVRPPGHHATAKKAMGFCLLNNVAGAAAAALSAGAKKVAIVDFDVHHGNGTQEIFWESPDVLYVSLHQWPWYPWRSGSLEEIGQGAGLGTTVNIPLPAMTGDAVYVQAMRRIVVPVLHEFAPDLILVSAGFDAHMDDPLSLMEVTEFGFGSMTAALTGAANEFCDGRLVMVLEGGYRRPALAQSVVASLRALSGEPFLASATDLTEGFPYSPLALDHVAEFHGARWKIA